MNAAAVSALNLPTAWAQEPVPAQKSASSGDFDALVAESIGLLTPTPGQPAAAWRIPDLSSLANLDSLNSGPLQQDAAPALSPAPLPRRFTAAKPVAPQAVEPQAVAPQTPASLTPAPIADSAEGQLAPEVTSADAVPDDAPPSEPTFTETPVTAVGDLAPPPATSPAHPAKATPTVKETPHALSHRSVEKAPRSNRTEQDAGSQAAAPVELPARSVLPVQETFSPAHQPHGKSASSEPSTHSHASASDTGRPAWTSGAAAEIQNITAAPPMRTAVDLRIREKRPADTDPKNSEESRAEESHAEEPHPDEARPEKPAATFRLPNAPAVEPSSFTEKHNASPEIAQTKQQADTPAPASQYTAAAPVPIRHPDPAPKAEPIPVPSSAHMDPALPQKEPATQPLRAFSLEFAPDGARDVRLHVSSHGGDVHVALRSNDEALSGRLRDGMHELVGNLSNAGYEADAWSPQDGGRRNQPEPAEEAPKPSRKRSGDLAGFEQMMQMQSKETL